jgi:signal peptidase II
MGRRYMMLALILVVGVAADQWTKLWADKSLGTLEHPLVLQITDAEAGQELGSVLRARFALTDSDLDELSSLGPSGLSQLFDAKRLVSEARAFPVYAEEPRLAYYWVFHHETFDMPPRRVPNAATAMAHLSSHGNATLIEYLRYALPYLGESNFLEVVPKWVFPVIHTPIAVETQVRSGDTYLLMHRTVSVIDGLVQLRYAENPGAAWGLLSDQSADFRRMFFFCVSMIAFLVIGYLFFRAPAEQHLSAVGFAWILAGAIGNFIDRVRFEYVIDFIDMYTGDLHWPTYNVADVEISIGVILLIVEAFRLGQGSYLGGTGRATGREAS